MQSSSTTNDNNKKKKHTSSSSPIFKLTHRLRNGHASVVWRCKDSKKRNTALAVKFITDGKQASDEVMLLQRFCHPNVIDVVDFFQHGDKFGIVMNATDMDLRQFMETELYDSATVCDFSRQCARGLHHVHTLETLHADMKPENIGISIAKREGERIRIHVRILDFGSAKLIHDIKPGDLIRSTLHYQSPEKRLGVFHYPGDIYELGVVYREVIDHSVDNAVSDKLYGELVSDMVQTNFLLRPTSQQVLVRLEDPQQALWERLCAIASDGTMTSTDDFRFLVECDDPLTFLMKDMPLRMEYIAKLAASDNTQQMERAFFLLFKTAQHEVKKVCGDGDPYYCYDHSYSVLQSIHRFHGTVDTTWWTKLFYCMTIDELSKLRYFALKEEGHHHNNDIVKIKLWTFSSVHACEHHVRNVLVRCMVENEDLLGWCLARRWGHDSACFAEFIGGDPAKASVIKVQDIQE